MDLQTFTALVTEAVTHLYDHPYLQTHHLGQVLVPDPSRETRGRALQRILRDAIQLLKPPAGSVSSSPAWRTYRYLFLRYVQAIPPHEVARELGISERQARRTYRVAIDALASVLWHQYQALEGRGHPSEIENPAATSRSMTAHKPPPFGTAMSPPTHDVTSDARQARTGGPLPSPPDRTMLDQEIRHLRATRQESLTRLADVVAGLNSILTPLAQQYHCKLTLALDPGLPGLDADRVVVRQILLNLCTVAATNANGWLRLIGRHNAGSVRIAVEFGAVRGAHILTDNASARLAVIGQLAESIGGAVETQVTESEVAIAVVLRAARRPTILIVDDNPDILSVLRRYLETSGFDVIEASNGTDGLHLAHEARPVAIILDVMMSSQDGWETLQHLKNHPDTQSTPVFICSVLREHELARVLGAADLLPKPVTRPDLLAALARAGLPLPPEAYQSNS